MMCCYCEGHAKKHGKDRKGFQRFRCLLCAKTFGEDRPKPLGDMRIANDKAILALRLFAEGTSVRSVERLTGLHRDTLCRLVVMAGQKGEALMREKIVGVKSRDVQCDELWGFVRMKQRTAKKLGIADDPTIGDAYGFVAMERGSKLILAWHLGKRTREHAMQFLDKLDHAASGRFQISTDAWNGYLDTVHHVFGGRADFATIEKQYAQPATNEARYSPPVVVGVKRKARFGKPSRKRMCTSHVERMNLSIRTFVKRLARLTLSFSKKWENLQAAMALNFAFYNFCRVHSSLRVTPAMEAGVTDHVWTIEELLAA